MFEALEREAQRGERGRVEPLNVVDRDAQRALAGEQTDRGEEGCAYRAWVSLGVGVGQQQRDLERAALDRGQVGENATGDVAEQVVESGV